MGEFAEGQGGPCVDLEMIGKGVAGVGWEVRKAVWGYGVVSGGLDIRVGKES